MPLAVNSEALISCLMTSTGREGSSDVTDLQMSDVALGFVYPPCEL